MDISVHQIQNCYNRYNQLIKISFVISRYLWIWCYLMNIQYPNRYQYTLNISSPWMNTDHKRGNVNSLHLLVANCCNMCIKTADEWVISQRRKRSWFVTCKFAGIMEANKLALVVERLLEPFSGVIRITELAFIVIIKRSRERIK